MKKLIALSVAVVMLLFGFAAVAEVGVVNEKMYEEITVSEDIKPRGNPRDISQNQNS